VSRAIGYGIRFQRRKMLAEIWCFDEAYMLGKCEDEASIDNQKGKQVVEVEFDDQSSPMDKSDDEQFSKDSQHQEEPYSLAKAIEKCDRKAPEKYGFEDMVSFALVARSGNPSSIQNGMPKEVE
jgi:hypothetical protein